MNNLVFVVTHKEHNIPQKAPYKSIAVGPNANLIESDLRDCIKDNIANKNSNYCELTAQYWVWKNYSFGYDNIGLCHYRRYFANSIVQRFKLLSDEKISFYLTKYDIILPKEWKWKVNVAETYYINGEGKEKDLIMTRKAISVLYPDYLDAFDFILKKYSASYCNMFITKKEYFLEYSKWLFDILTYVEKNTDLSNYTKSEARIYGYLSEILLNVWVQNKKMKVKYLPMIETELSKKSQIKRDVLNFLSNKNI